MFQSCFINAQNSGTVDLFAKLDNFCAVIDHNGLQIDGRVFQAMEEALKPA